MILNDLLSSDWFTPVNKKLAKDFWFIVAWYFGELLRQRKRFWEEEFYFSQKDMENEIWISEFEQRNSVKKLVEVNFLNVVKKWLPCKYFFTINDELVLEYFNHQCFKKWSTSALKNEAHNKNREIRINNNNNISKDILFEQNEKNEKSFLDLLKDLLLDFDFIEKLKNKFLVDNEDLKMSSENFLIYWTEKNPNWKKERWQMQKVFDIKKRFYTRIWNDIKFAKYKKNKFTDVNFESVDFNNI